MNILAHRRETDAPKPPPAVQLAVLATLKRHDGFEIRLKVCERNGSRFVSCRGWGKNPKTGTWFPAGGINFAELELPALVAALEQARTMLSAQGAS